MNQVIIAYHVVAHGEVRLSPELAEYKLFAPGDIVCWPAGTGYAVAEWLKSRGYRAEVHELRGARGAGGRRAGRVIE